MEDKFYIVLSESAVKTSMFANKRNAKIQASDNAISDPKQKHFVLESVAVAKTAPPVEVTDIKNGPVNSIEDQ